MENNFVSFEDFCDDPLMRDENSSHLWPKATFACVISALLTYLILAF